jgi:hypothetical protein
VPVVRFRIVLWLGLLACLGTGLLSAGVVGARVLDVPLGVVGPGQFAIAASAGAGGSISPEGEVGVDPGGSQAFSITPGTGYHILDVLVDGASVGAVETYTFENVDAGHTIAASFAIDTFTISPSVVGGAGGNGSIGPATDQTVDYGATPTFTFTPATGYHVAAVRVDGDLVTMTGADQYTFPAVTASHAISVEFAVDTFTITVSAGQHGSITPGTGQVDHGTSPTYTITPDTGYHIDSLTVDGQAQAAQGSWTFADVAANHSIAATFAIDQFTVTATAGAHGSISPAGATGVEYGGDVTFSILPDVSFRVADVVVDGVSQGPLASHTFTNVTASHTISATFTYGRTTRFDLDLGSTTVTYGRPTTIAATLLRADGTPVGGVNVALWATPSLGGEWQFVGNATTSMEPGSEGTSVAQVTPLQRMFYSFRYTPAQGSDDAAALSTIIVVKVRPLLGTPARPVSVKAGKMFTVSGSLTPHIPKGSATVQVRAYRLRGGHWRPAKRLTATITDRGDASKYSVRFKLTTRGTYRFRAEFPATGGWAATASGYSSKTRVR